MAGFGTYKAAGGVGLLFQQDAAVSLNTWLDFGQRQAVQNPGHCPGVMTAQTPSTRLTGFQQSSITIFFAGPLYKKAIGLRLPGHADQPVRQTDDLHGQASGEIAKSRPNEAISQVGSHTKSYSQLISIAIAVGVQPERFSGGQKAQI
jgi:hypothetical protein